MNDEKPSLVGELGTSAKEFAEATAARFNEDILFGLPAKVLDELGLSSEAIRAEQKAKSPVGSVLGGAAALGGEVAAGPTRAIYEVAEKLAPKAASPIGKAASKGAEWAGIGAGIEGAKSATAGDSPEEIAKHAGVGAAAGLAGLALKGQAAKYVGKLKEGFTPVAEGAASKAAGRAVDEASAGLAYQGGSQAMSMMPNPQSAAKGAALVTLLNAIRTKTNVDQAVEEAKAAGIDEATISGVMR